MKFNIAPSKDKKYIIIEISGNITVESIMQPIMQAHALGAKLKINRYLMDVTNARNVDSVVKNFHFAYEDMKTTNGIDQTAMVASLVDPDDHSHDFVETVLKNAGFNFKIFRNRQKAVDFLLEI
jgi:hypothetical protein